MGPKAGVMMIGAVLVLVVLLTMCGFAMAEVHDALDGHCAATAHDE